MLISLFLLTLGLAVLIPLWLNRHKRYISSYNYRYPLGRINDQKGFERWVEINGYSFAYTAIFMAALSTFFPKQEVYFFVLMFALILIVGTVFIIGSYRFLQ